MPKITSKFHAGWIHVIVNSETVEIFFETEINDQNKMAKSHSITFSEIKEKAMAVLDLSTPR